MNRNHRSHGAPMMGSVPMLGQQMSREQQAQREIAQMIHGLSLSIYSKMVTDHVAHRDVHRGVDPEALKRMAQMARASAEAYFEAMGIISVEPPSNGQATE